MNDLEHTAGHESLFRLENVWFRYSRSQTDFTFRDLSLEIVKGRSLGIIGPSGEGKSTLLKILTGLLVPERGRALIAGREIIKMTATERAMAMRRIGMTFQNSGLFDSLSCAENLLFPLNEARRNGDSTIDSAARVRDTLAAVELQGVESLRTHQLSGGMRKRLGIARAHILSPEVVLYDEPTAGLDPITSRAITDLILKLKREYQVTVVVVTNDPHQAFLMAESVVFLQHGRVLQTGALEDFRKSEVVEVNAFLHAFDSMIGQMNGPPDGTRQGGAKLD